VPAGLAVEILDRVLSAVMAIPDEGMDSRVGNLAIVTVRVGAGLTARVDALRVFRPRRLSPLAAARTAPLTGLSPRAGLWLRLDSADSHLAYGGGETVGHVGRRSLKPDGGRNDPVRLAGPRTGTSEAGQAGRQEDTVARWPRDWLECREGAWVSAVSQGSLEFSTADSGTTPLDNPTAYLLRSEKRLSR